ncbi:hypothetical protein, partial [Azospirillum formosense]
GVIPPYLWLLAIIGGRARFHRRILLEIGENKTGLMLRLTATALAVRAACSQSSGFSHIA